VGQSLGHARSTGRPPPSPSLKRRPPGAVEGKPAGLGPLVRTRTEMIIQNPPEDPVRAFVSRNLGRWRRLGRHVHPEFHMHAVRVIHIDGCTVVALYRPPKDVDVGLLQMRREGVD